MVKVAGAGSLRVVWMAGSCSFGAVGSLLACSFAWYFAWVDDWAIMAHFLASKWRPDAVILSVRRAMRW